MIEIGLYNAKYPFRKLLQFLLGYFKNSNPNHVSLMLLPIGFITALLYYYAPEYPFLYALGIVSIFIRMIVGTLDGMIAESFNKQTPNGTILNRLTPEAADMMLMAAITLSVPQHPTLNIFSLIIIWGISYAGLLGLAGGKRIQSIGPAGQTDRLVALMVFSLLQMLSLCYDWSLDFIVLFLWWVVIGGIITVALRCFRILTEMPNAH